MLKQREMEENFMLVHRSFLKDLEKSIEMLEKDIDEAAEMSTVCTDEWCDATEHVIDELSNALFSIHEPRWLNEEQSKELKRLKRKVYDLYVNYRGVYKKVA